MERHNYICCVFNHNNLMERFPKYGCTMLVGGIILIKQI
jgi:hypothetical protein